MPKLSKKIKEEMQFFINLATGKRQYNPCCKQCVHDCKQSYRAVLVGCPRWCKKGVAPLTLVPEAKGRS